MIIESTKYISPKDALEIFKSNGIAYIAYIHARDIYDDYKHIYVHDIIKDICTGSIKNKHCVSLDSFSFNDRVENREITVYEKKKVSCTNNSIEHMYVEVPPEVVNYDNYDSHYVNCEELLSFIGKTLIMGESDNK